MKITTSKMLDCAILNERGENNDEIRTYRNIRNAAEIFAIKAFLSVINANLTISGRSLSDEVDSNKIMTYCVAGRIMVTLQHGDNTVSIVGADDPKSKNRAGLQSANGDVDEILDVLEFFTSNWYKVKLKENENLQLV